MTPPKSQRPLAEPSPSTVTTDLASSEKCPVQVPKAKFDGFNMRLFDELEDAGCPMASHLKKRMEFEEFLTQLSNMFVNVAPSEVDSRIKSALQKIVEFLDIDRSGLSESSISEKRDAPQGKPAASFLSPTTGIKIKALNCKGRFGNRRSQWRNLGLVSIGVQASGFTELFLIHKFMKLLEVIENLWVKERAF